jgi:hypothetical protein
MEVGGAFTFGELEDRPRSGLEAKELLAHDSQLIGLGKGVRAWEFGGRRKRKKRSAFDVRR